MSARVSFIFMSPLLLLLLLARFQSFTRLFLPPDVEASFDQGDEGQQWFSCCAQQLVEGQEQGPPAAPLRPGVLLQLASSRLLLTLQCLSFCGLDSMSA